MKLPMTRGTTLSLLFVLALQGCASVKTPEVEMQNTPVVQLPATPPVLPTNGSIYQAGNFRPLFEDYRARMVGDTVTVQISESISATQSSTSELDHAGTLTGGITALPGISSNSFGRAGIAGNSSSTTTGKGNNQNTNVFTGTVTAVVTAVLPNGHLMVTAEKQIGVNRNVDVLRFTGQVDPRAIQQGNTVASSAIANVRIEQRGRGAMANAHEVGWLSRFFLSLAPI